MNEKNLELSLNNSNHNNLKPGENNAVAKPQSEYQSVFTKNLPKKTKQALISSFISVGKEHCSGKQLQSVLKLLNKTFTHSHVLFVIADTLQRFTYQLHGMNEKEGEEKAVQDGLEWKTQHASLIQNTLSNLTYDFIHWNQLTAQNESYKDYTTMVDTAYQEEESFRRKFDKTVTGFLSAQLGDKNVKYMVDNHLATQLCLLYLKEECAAHLVIANQKCSDINLPLYKEEGKFDYAVYPRSMSDAFEATYEKFISKDVLIYLAVRNKLLKQEELLHSCSGKKPEISSHQKPSFFKQPPRQKPEISLTESSNTTALIVYFTCLKSVLNSGGISAETKLELIKNIIEDGEKAFLKTPHNLSTNLI